MLTGQQVRESLNEVLVPGAMWSLDGLNLVREVAIADRRIKITLASAALGNEAQGWIRNKTKEVLGKLPEVNEVEIEFTEAKPSELNKIGHIIAVMSGKGGVGKSLVASLTAIALKRQGNEVGILDADITGSSIPRMFGITARLSGSESGILPALSRSGIEVMSINLLLPREDDAVIWRGPLIGKVITQFWEDVLWGKLFLRRYQLRRGRRRSDDCCMGVMAAEPALSQAVWLLKRLKKRILLKLGRLTRGKSQMPQVGCLRKADIVLSWQQIH